MSWVGDGVAQQSGGSLAERGAVQYMLDVNRSTSLPFIHARLPVVRSIHG